MKAKGLWVSVYRDASMSDSTNGGVSGYQDRFVLLGTNGPFEADNEKEGNMALTLVPGPFGTTRAVMANDETGEAIDGPPGEVGPMFGGNFIYSSDSRFPSDTPIKVFDRFETQQQYDALSR